MWRSCVSSALLFFAYATISVTSEQPETGQKYFIAGITAYQDGDFQMAHDAFSRCLELEPTRLDCMTNLASTVVDIGDNLPAAEELYRAVLAVQPNHLDAAFNLALMLQDHRTEAAQQECLRLYRIVVAGDPTRWDAWSNLASAAAEVTSRGLSDDPLEATRAYQRAIVELERTHEASGAEPDEAEVGYLTSLYYGLGTQLSSLSAAHCKALADDASSLLVGVDAATGNAAALDDAAAMLVCAENAQMALRNALDLDPSNVQAEHMLAAMLSATGGGGDGSGGGDGGRGPSVDKASSAFVKALFDDFSDSFDEKLAALGYQVPKLLGDATARYVAAHRHGVPFRSTLDAGGGTGLAGPYLRPLTTGTLSNVDMSPKMLDRSRGMVRDDGSGRPLYDIIHAADLLALTRAEILAPHERADGVELVAAADVMVYFGELYGLLGNMAQLSSAASALIFSCERATAAEAPNGWRLRPSGRFEHTKDYVVKVAHETGGWRLVSYTEITPRWEHGTPVRGHLFVFVRG